MRRIAILGAGGTGKTTLCLELATHLRGLGVHDIEVAESTAETVTGSPPEYDATLLAGLDIGRRGDGARQEAEDQRLRSLLQGAGIAFHVVYGQQEERLRSALRALRAAGVLPPGSGQSEGDQERGKPWAWVCEKCSDPACEHRLFTQLQSARR